MDFKFGITWLFDKLGYMPKIDVKVGEVDLKVEDTWPFPAPSKDFFDIPREPKKKPALKKASTRKAAVRKAKQ